MTVKLNYDYVYGLYNAAPQDGYPIILLSETLMIKGYKITALLLF